MFNQKYHPEKFSDFVFQNEVTRKRIESYVLGKKRDNILLYGPYGTGKSTIAQIIANETKRNQQTIFDVDIDVINCARFGVKKAEPIRYGAIERGWSMMGIDYPYAVFDEFDILDTANQDVVRDIMDRNIGRAGFILTTNHLHRIDGAIQSRCDVIEMPSLQPDALLNASQKILRAEGVTIRDEVVLDLVSSSCGNWRSLLRLLQDVVEGIQQKSAA